MEEAYHACAELMQYTPDRIVDSSGKNGPSELRITYIIGNGFDLGLGLETSYGSFIKSYVGLPIKNDSFAERRLKERILQTIETAPNTWDDAERAFAELPFTEMFSQDVLSRTGSTVNENFIKRSFLDARTAFVNAMKHYLKKEENRVKGVEEHELHGLRQRFVNRLLQSIIEGEYDKCSEGIDKRLTTCAEQGQWIFLSCVNLNYTSTFDYLFHPFPNPTHGQGPKRGYSFRRIMTGFGNYAQHLISVNVEEPIHVHGSLGEDACLFGVSSCKQISDPIVSNLCGTTGVFIKKREDSQRNSSESNYSAALERIRKSEWIVVFGTSLGESDKHWWSLICKELLNDRSKRVFVFWYRREPVQISTWDHWLLHQDEVRTIFASYLRESNKGIDETTEANCLDRIVTMTDGPYRRMDESMELGDPFDLSWFAEKLGTPSGVS